MRVAKLKQSSIRVFISSTFVDMQEERDELVKLTFPKLRQQYEHRGIYIIEVDFRWGITDKEKELDGVLPICLEEIDNCRPFFIGIIGNRYGDPLKKIPKSYLSKFPWLKDNYSQKSITEIEIIYGALNDQYNASNAYFYFKDQENFSPDETNLNVIDQPDKEKLTSLKEQIKQRGFKPRIYSNSKDLGKLVYEDFRILMEKLFPEDTSTNLFEKENLAHQLFAQKQSKMYFGKSFYFRYLNDYIKSNFKLPLVLFGECGSGKSALLASWAEYYNNDSLKFYHLSTSLFEAIAHFFKSFAIPRISRTKTKKTFLITHFIGATVESTNWIIMLQRILNIFKEELDIDLPIPDQPIKLVPSFLNWLQISAKKAKIILIIDGIDKLEDREQSLDLNWLPEKLPANIRLILSTNGGPSFEEVKRRGWPLFKISPLKRNERKQFISSYLKQYSKSLDIAQIEQIVNSRQTENPMFLKTVLEELRVSAVYDILKTRISYYVEADSLESLFNKILERLEIDLNKNENERKELVSDCMKLLWGARQGLTERELLNILGYPGNSLPFAYWSRIYLAIKEFILERSGILTFFHDTFRKAVENRYLISDEEKYSIHRRLANYFSVQNMGLRKIEELPWHLAAIHSWNELFSLLANTEFLKKAWERHRWEVKSYWALLEQNTTFTMAQAYCDVINSPQKNRDCAWEVCFLLLDTAYTKESLILAHFLEQKAREEKNYDELQASLSLQATLLKNMGKLDRALILLEEQEKLCRQLSNFHALASSLGNQGVLYIEKGDFHEALDCFKEEEKICLRIDDLAGLSVNKGNQGIFYMKNKQFEKALGLFLHQETICRQLGDISGLQKSLGHQALIFLEKGNIKKTLKFYKEAESICRQLGDEDALQTLLGNQALAYQELGDYDKAMYLLDEREKICRKLKDPSNLIRALIQKFNLFAINLKAIDYAEQFIDEAHQIAVENNLETFINEIAVSLKSFK